jgi:hypothetical protein
VAIFVDIACLGERSARIIWSRNRQACQDSILSPAHSSFLSDWPRWGSLIVGPMNLSGGAVVKEQGRASRFAPWRIAALALSGEPRFQRYLGSRRVLTAEELKSFPA